MNLTVKNLEQEMKREANPSQAKNLARFFKTGPGEYGAGDKFLGIMVPETRAVARRYSSLTLSEIARLLASPFHEVRLAGLLILVDQFARAGKNNEDRQQKNIFTFYLKQLKLGRINNWDLIDLSAPKIIGKYLLNKGRSTLYQLARSRNLWERRVSILATFAFIKNDDFADALKIAKILLADKHDLIHKAIGWMLREVGKKNQRVEEEFLRKHYRALPRTALRYAIERFPEGKRRRYLQKR